MSTGDGYDHRYGRKRRVLRIAVGPATCRTPVNDVGCQTKPPIRPIWVNGFNPRRLKVPKWMSSPRNGLYLPVCEILLSIFVTDSTPPVCSYRPRVQYCQARMEQQYHLQQLQHHTTIHHTQSDTYGHYKQKLWETSIMASLPLTPY